MMDRVEKLYYTDRYRKSIVTKIKNIVDFQGKIGIVFEEEIFFPGGGGQVGDSGFIKILDDNYSDENLILDNVISRADGNIHFLKEKQNLKNRENKKIKNFEKEDIDIEKKLKPGVKVELVLDWDKREDNMHQHTAQHILSGCFFKLFSRNTKGLHIGKDFSQLDIEGDFNDEMIMKVEKYANDVINQSIEIENYEIDKENKEIYTRRPLPDTDDEIRVLKIGELDINACCGVHALNTKDIKFIKIKKYLKHKDGTRIEYLAGKRAIDYVLNRDNIFDRVLKKFNCSENNIENAIDNLENKKDEFHEMQKYLTKKVILFEFDKLEKEYLGTNNDVFLVNKIFDGEKSDLLVELAKYIAENNKAVVLFANKLKEHNEIIFMVSKELVKQIPNLGMGKLFKENADLIDAKGGGSNFVANGRGNINQNLDLFMKKSKEAVSDLLKSYL